jgi:hypothetical protein
MLASLLGIGVKAAFSELRGALKERQDAKTEQDRIAADERVRLAQARVRAMEVRGMAAWIRALFGLPLGIWFAKIMLWDLTLGRGTTDPLSGQVAELAQMVLAFYFVSEAGLVAARMWRSK